MSHYVIGYYHSLDLILVLINQMHDVDPLQNVDTQDEDKDDSKHNNKFALESLQNLFGGYFPPEQLYDAAVDLVLGIHYHLGY